MDDPLPDILRDVVQQMMDNAVAMYRRQLAAELREHANHCTWPVEEILRGYAERVDPDGLA